MPNPAVVADVTDRWRPLSAQETTNAQTFLDDAWRMLKRQLAAQGVDIEALMVDDADLTAEVIRVEATAVLRVMKNPDAMRQESIDDYSYTRDEAVSSGLLYFTDDEIGALVPGMSSGRRAFSIDLLGDYESRFL
jgi:hypothetical protein